VSSCTSGVATRTLAAAAPSTGVVVVAGGGDPPGDPDPPAAGPPGPDPPRFRARVSTSPRSGSEAPAGRGCRRFGWARAAVAGRASPAAVAGGGWPPAGGSAVMPVGGGRLWRMLGRRRPSPSSGGSSPGRRPRPGRPGPAAAETAAQCHAAINQYRAKAGLDNASSTSIKARAVAAGKHAAYRVNVGPGDSILLSALALPDLGLFGPALNAHLETPSLVGLGFTGVNPWDRTRAAKLADGTWRYQYEDVTTASGIPAANLQGVRSWIDAPYHRLPLLDANTRHIGCAASQRQVGYVITVQADGYHAMKIQGIAFSRGSAHTPVAIHRAVRYRTTRSTVPASAVDTSLPANAAMLAATAPSRPGRPPTSASPATSGGPRGASGSSSRPAPGPSPPPDRGPGHAWARSSARMASTSRLTKTSSLTTTPPLSSWSFQLTPKSCRLIRVVAENPTRCMTPRLTPPTQ
jgi:hypothetical protein